MYLNAITVIINLVSQEPKVYLEIEGEKLMSDERGLTRSGSMTDITPVIQNRMTPEKGKKANFSKENIRQMGKAAAGNPAQLPLFYALLGDYYRPCQNEEYKKQLQKLYTLIDKLVLSLRKKNKLTEVDYIAENFISYKNYRNILLRHQSLGEYRLHIQALEKTTTETPADIENIQEEIKSQVENIDKIIQEYREETKTWWLLMEELPPSIFNNSGIPLSWKPYLTEAKIDELMGNIEVANLSELIPTFLIFATGVGNIELIKFLLPLTAPSVIGSEIPTPPAGEPRKWYPTAMYQLGVQLAKGTFEIISSHEVTHFNATLHIKTPFGEDEYIHTTHNIRQQLFSSPAPQQDVPTIFEITEDDQLEKEEGSHADLLDASLEIPAPQTPSSTIAGTSAHASRFPASSNGKQIEKSGVTETRSNLKILKTLYEEVTVRKCHKSLEIAPLPTASSSVVSDEQSIYEIRDLFLQRLHELNCPTPHLIRPSLADDIEECATDYLQKVDDGRGQSRKIAETLIELSKNAKFFAYLGIETTDIGLMQALPLVLGARDFGFQHKLLTYFFKDDGLIRGSRLANEINKKLMARGYRLCHNGDVRYDKYGPFIEIEIKPLPERKVQAPPAAYTRKKLAIIGAK